MCKDKKNSLCNLKDYKKVFVTSSSATATAPSWLWDWGLSGLWFWWAMKSWKMHWWSMQMTSSAGVLCPFWWKSPGAMVIFHIYIHGAPLTCLTARVLSPFVRSGHQQWWALAPAETIHTFNLKRLWDGTQRNGSVDPGGEQASCGAH